MRFLTVILSFLLAVAAYGVDMETLLGLELMSGGLPTQEPTASPTTTHAPTRSPTRRPTSPPTKIDLVDITIGNSITGMSAAEYNANAAAYTPVFKTALAVAMSIDSSDIVEIVVTATQDVIQGRRLAAGSSCYMKYRVVLHDSSKSFTSLTALLKVAFTPVAGVTPFAALLDAAATSNSVALPAVTIAAPKVVNNRDHREASSQLTGTQIAGLVIGIVMCVGLIAVLAFFIASQKSAFAAADSAEAGNQSNQVDQI